MSESTITFSILPLEGVHLLRLVDALSELLGAPLRDDARLNNDPALTRLTPSPYPEDAEAAAAFRSATEDDLLDRRSADAAIVRSGLAPFDRGDVLEALGDTVPKIEVAEQQVDAWMRTLTTLRLVLATRIGIVDDDDHVDGDVQDDDPRRGVYDWLGYRLEMLVQAADARD